MGVIERCLSRLFAKELSGAKLDDTSPWRVAPTRDAARFLRALPALELDGATLYLEGTTEAAVQDFLTREAAPNGLKMALGTIWPRPDRWHLAATPDRLEALAALVERAGVPVLSTHAHVYVQDRVVLEWHDAFDTDPILLSDTLRESRVGRFARALGTTVLGGPGTA